MAITLYRFVPVVLFIMSLAENNKLWNHVNNCKFQDNTGCLSGQQLQLLIEISDVVSFDIFDTLVQRPYA